MPLRADRLTNSPCLGARFRRLVDHVLPRAGHPRPPRRRFGHGSRFFLELDHDDV